MTSLSVFIEPTTGHFLDDRLFGLSDPVLNRDNQLLPFSRLRDQLRSRGVALHTADHLRAGRHLSEANHYWSIGQLDGHAAFARRQDVVLKGFMMFEPPLVAPQMYAALAEVSSSYQHVFLHNTTGDGYSLKTVDTAKLEKFFVPQPYEDVVEPYWSADRRQNKIVVIAGNHNPGSGRPEFYSRRIEAVAALAPLECIDLFGKGWDRWWSRHSMWLPYWRHRLALRRTYRGACESKFPVLARYDFALCLENMPMRGYVTEKIFDCFYAGAIPLYQGGDDVHDFIPADTFIDVRAFDSWKEMWKAVSSLPAHSRQRYREAAREFIRSPGYAPYYHALDDTILRLSLQDREAPH